MANKLITYWPARVGSQLPE